MDTREFVEKLFNAITARVDQFFKAKNIQGGVRCGDDMFSMVDKVILQRYIDQFRAQALKEAAGRAEVYMANIRAKDIEFDYDDLRAAIMGDDKES